MVCEVTSLRVIYTTQMFWDEQLSCWEVVCVSVCVKSVMPLQHCPKYSVGKTLKVLWRCNEKSFSTCFSLFGGFGSFFQMCSSKSIVNWMLFYTLQYIKVCIAFIHTTELSVFGQVYSYNDRQKINQQLFFDNQFIVHHRHLKKQNNPNSLIRACQI